MAKNLWCGRCDDFTPTMPKGGCRRCARNFQRSWRERNPEQFQKQLAIRKARRPPAEPREPKWSSDQVARILKRHEAGETFLEIATSLSVTRNTIAGIIKRGRAALEDA